jgi:hypothetical protein|tara:strand:- start:6 stop:1034 length:1029 start_codon:yes stop_codon:yes gene_type:complete
MTTYKEIKGTQIEVVSSDPSNPVEGQVWYNSTDNVLKGNVVVSASFFATGGSLNTARYGFSGTGTQTAGLVAGGSTPSNTGITELYNGSNWTETTDLNTARNQTSQGTAATQTATIVWGGYPSYPGSYRTETELWNGSNWTEVNDLSYGQSNGGAAGTSTSAIFGGGTVQPGNPYSGDFSVLSQSWNGTNWTTVNDINTARYAMNSAGGGADNTSAVIFGGLSGPSPYQSRAFTELWNGTNWTEVNDMNTGRIMTFGTGATATAAVAIGGQTTPPSTNKSETELWNGTNWSEDTNIPTATYNGASGGTSSSAFTAGGQTPSVVATTFEFTGAGPVTRTFTDS